MLDNIHHRLNNEHNMAADIDMTAYKDIDIPIDIAADTNVDVTVHIAADMNVDVAANMNDDDPCSFEPISNVAQIF
jgi:hypothetical protein